MTEFWLCILSFALGWVLSADAHSDVNNNEKKGDK